MFIPKLSLEYLESLLPVTMGFLHHGILHNYIECDVFMEFAIREARKNPEVGSNYLDLFVSDEPSEQLAIILKMCDANSETTDIADAWLFVLECSIRDFSQSTTEMLDKIEDLYESTDYPTELSPFVRYMPCSNVVLDNVNRNEEQMIVRFKQFLAEKRKRVNHV